jgi:hypothetical protein
MKRAESRIHVEAWIDRATKGEDGGAGLDLERVHQKMSN